MVFGAKKGAWAKCDLPRKQVTWSIQQGA